MSVDDDGPIAQQALPAGEMSRQCPPAARQLGEQRDDKFDDGWG